MLERRTVRDSIAGHIDRGYFDVIGSWRGPDLVMEARGDFSHPFRCGLRFDHASLTLHPDDHWTCKSACSASHSHF